tara:strand:+ start:743 stop:1111 length:369 start_codon:yes stop_codon:yes gene_type:complete
MDLVSAICRIRPNCSFSSGNDDYSTLEWDDTNTQTKPTLAECEAAWQEIVNEAPMKRLRQERNQKLKESDKYSLPDWPHLSEEVKQAWLAYRQALRDLPSTASPQIDANGALTNVTWPTSPS